MGVWTPGPGPTGGDDTFLGDGANDVADGGAGEDSLLGFAGDDELSGGAGDDILVGGDGDDILNGGADGDTASYADAASFVSVNLAIIGSQNTIGAGSDTLILIERLTGSGFDDFLTGDGAANTLSGGEGDDSLFGSDGLDTLFGGNGNDTLQGGRHADVLNGGAGSDTASYDGAIGAVIANLENSAANTDEAAGDTYISIENITGSTFNDTLIGDAGANILNGNLGDDILIGGAGADQLNGGDGADTFIVNVASMAVSDAYNGDAGSDTIRVSDTDSAQYFNFHGATVSSIERIEFASTIGTVAFFEFYGSQLGAGFSNTTHVVGSTLADVFNITNATGATFSLADWTFEDWSANDEILLNGSSGNDTITGSSQADRINGGAGIDILIGGDGNDRFEVNPTNLESGDQFYGGNGTDTIRVSDTNTSQFFNFNGATVSSIERIEFASTNGTVAFFEFYGSQLGAGFSNTTHVVGSSIGDVFNITSPLAANFSLAGWTFENWSANDELLLNGSAGADIITGSSQADRISGGDGADTLRGGAGIDTLNGGDGDDRLVGGAGADVLNGGSGIDLVEYSSSGARVRVNLTSGTGRDGDAEGDTLTGIENINGSIYNDNLVGSSAANQLIGGRGNDSLFGMGGNDTLKGGDGADSMDGGDGIDTVTYSTSLTRVRVNLKAGTAKDGEAAGDTLVSIENVTGTDYNDGLTGSEEANVLSGRSGNDTLAGLGGSDTLTGGAGSDTFVFGSPLGPSNIDTITDFNVADDTIWLNGGPFASLGSGTLSVAAFHIGASAADASDRIIYDAATGALYFDADGSGAGAAVQFAQLAPGLALTNQDFILGP